jgi:DNA-binding HxlR family transcriptional regulator
MDEATQNLLSFFKALADENRLKIVGLLARESMTGEQLAEVLKVKPATVSHHLAKLAEAGLVSGEMEGHSKPYTLRLDAIHDLAKQLLAEETLPQAAADLDVEAYDRKVLKSFLKRDGSLKEIPAQEKKLQVVVRHLSRQFEPGRKYTEKEVNKIIAGFHPDTASLRRALVDYQLLERDASGRRYWVRGNA